LFVNGRSIRDRSLQHALSEAYRGLLMTGRQPICFLRLGMPPDSVDVNVHPTKAEVRFQDAGRLYSQLLATLRTRFLSTDLTVRYELPDRVSSSRAELASDAWAAERLTAPTWNRASLPATGGTQDIAACAWLESSLRSFGESRPSDVGDSAAVGWQDSTPRGSSGGQRSDSGEGAPPRSSAVAALQVHNRYLVTESEEGVVVFDQHALHERILYEQLRERVLGGTPESQTLLVPEPVELRPAEAAAVLEQRELLAQLGVDVQAFGGNTVLVRGYPAMLANISPAEVLRDLVEHLTNASHAPESRNLLDELLQRIACKAAIKAGDRLAAEEITALLAQRHHARDSHHCPHGRPTALVFTREELDRQFKRI
jgi:DNA mismatch repair protein MutL